jgi:hypothetical protein
MKTKLTLNVGSFYFLSTVNLMRGVSAEVDLSSLTVAELNGLKSYVRSGSISTEDDISKYEIPTEEVDTTTITPIDAEAPAEKPDLGFLPPVDNVTVVEEEVTEDVIKELEVEAQEGKEVSTEDTKEDLDYENMLKSDVTNEIAKRGIKTNLTRKDQLIDLLIKDDKKNK